MSQRPSLVLASSSPYRRELLARVFDQFDWCNPAVDETPGVGEPAQALVQRLAESKAKAGAELHPASVIIAADQVALCQGRILTKPGSHSAAVAQLRLCSGQAVDFVTGLCLFDAAKQRQQTSLETFTVQFRALDEGLIERYLRREQPYDCAGAIKSEGAAIALFAAMRGDDSSALIGLPLIRLLTMLQQWGIAPLS